jgi:hypothetical protein
MPVMVVSINTLYLYDDLLRKKGITNVIDSFVRDYAVFDERDGIYHLPITADFDAYLRRNSFKKAGDAVKWIRGFIGNQKTITR